MDYYRHNQLAETVRCYQQFTSQFQTWLVNTAVQRGIEVASIVNNPTKKAKYKKTYNLPVENQEEIVNAVAAVAAPLMDISGLDDLRDALRLRKEVTEYHKYRNTADEGHEFINGNLEDLMATLRNILPPERRPRERQDKKPTFVYVRWSSTSTQVNQDALLEKAQEQGELELEENRQSYRKPTPKKKKPEVHPLTEKEEELQREFPILCFLYLFNRLRDIIREVWLLYHHGRINAATAALVTDLAQNRVHLNVNVLVEELDTSPGQLLSMIRTLFDKINHPPDTGSQQSAALPSGETLRHLFCLDATTLIKAYNSKFRPGTDSYGALEPEHPLMLFLRVFDVIRKNELSLPQWDHFTREILLHPGTSRDYLPFGFQIMLDIQEIVREDYRRLLESCCGRGGGEWESDE